MGRETVGAVLAGAVLSLTAAGCGSAAESLDRTATQRKVGRAVAASVSPPVTATVCAGELPLEQGHTFTCTVELGGGAGTLRAEVRQTDGKGTLAVEPLDAVLSDEEIADQLKAALKAQFDRSFQADCGTGGQQVRRPRSTSTCTARDRTSRRKVTVTIEDASGNLSFRVGKPA